LILELNNIFIFSILVTLDLKLVLKVIFIDSIILQW